MNKRNLIIFVFGVYSLCSACLVNAACDQNLPQIEYSSHNHELTLRITAITSLPDGIIFLGGYYTEQTTEYHSALLISKDGGMTWEDSGFSFPFCQIGNFQTYGKSYIWGIVMFTPEGLTTPSYLLRSTNAGRTWCVISLENMLHDDLSIPYIGQFDFFDEDHGILSVNSITQTLIDTHYTQDGGMTWQRLWLARRTLDIETGGYYPDTVRQTVQEFPYAPLWTKDQQEEQYKIAGVIRARENSDGKDIVIESYDYESKDGWRERSKISAHCLLKDHHLVPIDSQPR